MDSEVMEEEITVSEESENDVNEVQHEETMASLEEQIDEAMMSQDEDESDVRSGEAGMTNSEMISHRCKVCDFEDDVMDMVIEHLKNHTVDEKLAVKNGAQIQKKVEGTNHMMFSPL